LKKFDQATKQDEVSIIDALKNQNKLQSTDDNSSIEITNGQ
jgi:hypothetical protein